MPYQSLQSVSTRVPGVETTLDQYVWNNPLQDRNAWFLSLSSLRLRHPFWDHPRKSSSPSWSFSTCSIYFIFLASLTRTGNYLFLYLFTYLLFFILPATIRGSWNSQNLFAFYFLYHRTVSSQSSVRNKVVSCKFLSMEGIYFWMKM